MVLLKEKRQTKRLAVEKDRLMKQEEEEETADTPFFAFQSNSIKRQVDQKKIRTEMIIKKNSLNMKGSVRRR